MHTQKSKKGFTLVEIMIVVVIIGLLAAMAIPAFDKVRSNAKVGTMNNDARQLASAAQQYLLENSVTTVAVTIGADGAVNDPIGEYVKKVGSGYTFVGPLTIDGTFSLQHAQANENVAIVYNAEGQKN